MPQGGNHLAVIIESAVLSESVRTHEAETKVALGILAHKGGCDTAACPYVFYATGDSQHDGELVKMIRIFRLGPFCCAVTKNAAFHDREIRKTTLPQNFVCATVEIASIGNSRP